MSNENNSKTIQVLCDDGRRHIAELLPQLVDKIGSCALGQDLDQKTPDVSLPHAKFLLELAEYLGVVQKDEKNSKVADETPNPQAAQQPSSFWADLYKSLNVQTGKAPEHNSSALK